MFCWLFRLAISHAADGDKALSAMTRRHVNRCPHCQEFYRLCRSMGEGLTRQAAALSRDNPTILTDRILGNLAGTLGPSTYGQASGSARVRGLTTGIGLRPTAVAACIVLISLAGVFFLVQRHYVQRRSRINETAAVLRSLIGQGRAPRLATLVEEPLAAELQNIVADTETAARFLWTCVAVDVAGNQVRPVN